MCTFEEGLCKEWIDADKSTDKNKKKYRIFADTLNYDGYLRNRAPRTIDRSSCLEDRLLSSIQKFQNCKLPVTVNFYRTKNRPDNKIWVWILSVFQRQRNGTWWRQNYSNSRYWYGYTTNKSLVFLILVFSFWRELTRLGWNLYLILNYHQSRMSWPLTFNGLK